MFKQQGSVKNWKIVQNVWPIQSLGGCPSNLSAPRQRVSSFLSRPTIDLHGCAARHRSQVVRKRPSADARREDRYGDVGVVQTGQPAAGGIPPGQEYGYWIQRGQARRAAARKSGMKHFDERPKRIK